MRNLFAYGTLMCDDIMFEVSACCPVQEPGVLKGYSRRLVKGESYPAIVPDGRSVVEGVIFRDIPEAAWDRLDEFEGDMYERQPVDIESDKGEILSAEVYVIKDQYSDHLEPFDWDFADFIANGKERFKRQYLS